MSKGSLWNVGHAPICVEHSGPWTEYARVVGSAFRRSLCGSRSRYTSAALTSLPSTFDGRSTVMLVSTSRVLGIVNQRRDLKLRLIGHLDDRSHVPIFPVIGV